MRKPITYLNVVLLLMAVWMAAGIRQTWRQNHARYALAAPPATATAQRASTPATAGLAARPAGVVPASAGYNELVARNLFSPDRNNQQPVERIGQRPPPPLPLVIGTLNLGSGLVALMAENRGAGHRRLKVGDEIGGYRVVEIAEHKVVVEFQGEQKSLDVYESAEAVAPPVAAPGSAAEFAPPPASSAVQGQVHNAVPSASAPAPPTGPASSPAAQAPPGMPTSDPYTTYTIEGNRKKYSRRTPFGIQNWYEDIPPGSKP